jgi:hypothetical protein
MWIKFLEREKRESYFSPFFAPGKKWLPRSEKCCRFFVISSFAILLFHFIFWVDRSTGCKNMNEFRHIGTIRPCNGYLNEPTRFCTRANRRYLHTRKEQLFLTWSHQKKSLENWKILIFFNTSKILGAVQHVDDLNNLSFGFLVRCKSSLFEFKK